MSHVFYESWVTARKTVAFTVSQFTLRPSSMGIPD